MGSICSVKEKNAKKYNADNKSSYNSRPPNLITKHSSQFKEQYSKYCLFENRWTTTRNYQKLPQMVQKNFQKILERGIAKPKHKTLFPLEKENDFLKNTNDLKPNPKLQINETVFKCDSESFHLNKKGLVHQDLSLEIYEFSELSNLIFMNMNFMSAKKKNFDLNGGDKSLAKQKLNKILGTIDFN